MRRTKILALDEAALVRRFVRRRDERAFRTLYGAHARAMLAVAWRFVDGDRAEAEDVVQEAWIVAAERLATFRGESALRTWLVGITVGCARNRRRRRATAAAREVELASVAELPAPPPVSRDVTRVDLERAIARLPDGYREVLVLHDVFGYTHEDIARILQVDSGTSKSQLSRARSSLRRWLDGSGTKHHDRRSE
jgi:RNA polymerase sigma-70 factor (ECF subfamily)